LVEYGVARFGLEGSVEGIVADEPLALLAAVHHFTTNSAWSFRHFLQDALSTSNDSSRGFAFEHFGAFLLAMAFRSPARLSSVFRFAGSNSLENENAQLVALHKTDGGGFVCNPVNIFSNEGPTYTLGHTARTELETLSWLHDPKRTVFCFPAKSVGPDAILVLELSDRRVVSVLVQFKQLTKDTLGPQATAKAFETTDPQQFNSRTSVRSIAPIFVNFCNPVRLVQNQRKLCIQSNVESGTSGRFA
jgi:hypothetical protein